jgi:phage terminase large subunit-like protein
VWTPERRKLTERTTLGYECITFSEEILGLTLLPWQRWFLLHALELHPTEKGQDGNPLFRFRKIVLLVGRQNGKSTVMQALTLWRMFVDRCNLVIGTAQDLEVAESLLKESYELAEEVDELKSELGPLMRGAGKMQFRLQSGETYKVKAASRRSGRGLSGELVLLDELREHQSWDCWAAVTKTTNAKERAQIYAVSNAGDASSVVLRYLRKMAHAALGDPDGINAADAPVTLLPAVVGDDDLEDFDLVEDDDSLGIFEWSAPVGADLHDRDAWAQANPSLGHLMRESTIASDAHTDPEWVFRTEVLCQWSDGSLEGRSRPARGMRARRRRTSTARSPRSSVT